MIYAIQALQRLIKEHQSAIVKLENVEHEMQASEIFCEEEIVERRNYIFQLQKAITKLNS